MTKAKSTFMTFLGEWDGTIGATGAYAPYVLQHTQLTQNNEEDPDEEQETEAQRAKEARIRKDLEDSLHGSTNQDDSIVVNPYDRKHKDARLLGHLKNLLFREPGYADTDSEGDVGSGGPEDDTGSSNDHEIFYHGRQLVSNGEPVANSEYSFMDDPTNPHRQPTGIFSPTFGVDEDKRSQLLSAIRELRGELRRSRNQTAAIDQDAEEEEDSYEEDQANDETSQYDNAAKLFQTLVNQKMSRGKIIAAFQKQLGVTNSTAVSYYQRLAKQAGLTNSGDRELPNEPPGLRQARGMNANQMQYGVGSEQAFGGPEESNVSGQEVEGDPNRQGLIRYVKGAHLVYKRSNNEGSYDELWVFGVGNKMDDSLKVRRDILAGTDIPPRAMKSANGQQSYTLKTLGNGQLLHIKGLPN